MRRIWWGSDCIGRFQQNLMNKFRYPYIQLLVFLIFPWMWTIWRINWQIVNISVSCKIFVLTSTYLFSNILQKRLSTIDFISQNCRTLHLQPLNVNVIQMVTQSVQSLSARLSIYCGLLYWQRGTKDLMLLICHNICACTSNTFVNTELCEAQYRYAPHNDVSVNDWPHIRRWSHNILILQYLPLCYNCLQYSVQ